MDLYQKVYINNRLWQAWFHVRSRGRASSHPAARNEIETYDRAAFTNIRSLVSRLAAGTFVFEPETGTRKVKKNGEWRPVVRGTIDNRIIRRAILNTLQELPAFKPYFDNPFSFGGIAEKGVSTAIAKLEEAISNGATYYIASDISNFFTKVPKERVLSDCAKVLGTGPFLELLSDAIRTELQNFSDLGEDAERFPLGDEGIAQGSCLSPMVGNIVLRSFDSEMNSADVTCLRYIDDFIILGSRDPVKAKFKRGLDILGTMNMSAYRPNDGSKKASSGAIADGFDYLGVTRTNKGFTRPSKASKEKMINNLFDVFEASLKNNKGFEKKGLSFVDVTKRTKLTLNSWIKQYYFCTDQKLLIDTELHAHTLYYNYRESFFENYHSQLTIPESNKSFGLKPILIKPPVKDK